MHGRRIQTNFENFCNSGWILRILTNPDEFWQKSLKIIKSHWKSQKVIKNHKRSSKVVKITCSTVLALIHAPPKGILSGASRPRTPARGVSPVGYHLGYPKPHKSMFWLSYSWSAGSIYPRRVPTQRVFWIFNFFEFFWIFDVLFCFET